MSDLQTTAKEILIALIAKTNQEEIEDRPSKIVNLSIELAELLLNETE